MDELESGSERTIAVQPGTIAKVAAILISIGVLLKLYHVHSQRADDRAFNRILKEIEKLRIPAEGKNALRDVVGFARELAREARAKATRS